MTTELSDREAAIARAISGARPQSTDLELRRPEGIPAILFWPAVVIAFPFALVAGMVMIPRLLRKPKKPKPLPPSYKTPCGLCRYSEPHGHSNIQCGITRRWGGSDELLRKEFTTPDDPNNCSMFQARQ